jgi:hypothetical protein
VVNFSQCNFLVNPYMATYSYGERSGLSTSELFFWITVDSALEHLGVDDVVAMVAIVSGQPTIATGGKFGGATPGTSPVSLFLSRHLDYKMPFRLPTLTGSSLRTLRIAFTNNLGRFAGRAIPVVG